MRSGCTRGAVVSTGAGKAGSCAGSVWWGSRWKPTPEASVDPGEVLVDGDHARGLGPGPARQVVQQRVPARSARFPEVGFTTGPVAAGAAGGGGAHRAALAVLVVVLAEPVDPQVGGLAEDTHLLGHVRGGAGSARDSADEQTFDVGSGQHRCGSRGPPVVRMDDVRHFPRAPGPSRVRPAAPNGSDLEVGCSRGRSARTTCARSCSGRAPLRQAGRQSQRRRPGRWRRRRSSTADPGHGAGPAAPALTGGSQENDRPLRARHGVGVRRPQPRGRLPAGVRGGGGRASRRSGGRPPAGGGPGLRPRVRPVAARRGRRSPARVRRRGPRRSARGYPRSPSG